MHSGWGKHLISILPPNTFVLKFDFLFLVNTDQYLIKSTSALIDFVLIVLFILEKTSGCVRGERTCIKRTERIRVLNIELYKALSPYGVQK